MQLKDQFKYLVGGYYGVNLIDEYPLKIYILKDIENYIKDFIKANHIEGFDYKQEASLIKSEMSNKTKLQDALIVLQLIDAPMELVFIIKKRLKNHK